MEAPFDFQGRQFEGHGPPVILSLQFPHDALEINDTLSGRQVEVIGLGLPSPVVVHMDMFDSV